MAGRNPPPLFVQGATYKVGEMVGFGPSPGWEYLNAVKVGVTRQYFGSPPTQYVEYDVLEYIHPTWDKSLDYSKKKMPSRMWLNGMLYSPGRWLTSAQRGQDPTTVECQMGNPRFRKGMNYPAEDVKTDRVVNQSHPFRIWKPYTKYPIESQVMPGPNASVWLARAPDGPMVYAFPVNTADENQHYTGNFAQVQKIHTPNVGQPWKSVPFTDNSGGKFFRIKGYDYEKPDNTPITVSSNTGKMTSFDVLCVNAEGDFSAYWEQARYEGFSFSNIFTESQVTTVTEEFVLVPNDNGSKRLKYSNELTIGGSPPAEKKHYISQTPYDNYRNFNEPYGFYGMYEVGMMRGVFTYIKQSYWQGDVLKPSVYTRVDKQTGTGGNYQTEYKDGTKYSVNIYLFSGSTPFLYTRDAKVEQESVKYVSTRSYTYADCEMKFKNDDDGTKFGKQSVIKPKRWGISIGGNGTPPTGGFQNNTYYNDAHSMGSAEYMQMYTRNSVNRYTDVEYGCDIGSGNTVTESEALWNPRQWGWVQ